MTIAVLLSFISTAFLGLIALTLIRSLWETGKYLLACLRQITNMFNETAFGKVLILDCLKGPVLNIIGSVLLVLAAVATTGIAVFAYFFMSAFTPDPYSQTIMLMQLALTLVAFAGNVFYVRGLKALEKEAKAPEKGTKTASVNEA